MLKDDIGYLSDTVSYIGYNYIQDCSRRYKAKYSELEENDLLNKMCECMEISKELLKENEQNSGGAQYLLKNITSEFWNNVEQSCYKLFKMLKDYEAKYPIDHHIQSWTTDMWCVLWHYWKLGNKTKVHKELDFSWATDNRQQYYTKNIFHLAGVTDKEKHMFYKGKYINSNIFDVYKNNNSAFDHVSNDSITIEYVNMIKEYVDLQPKKTTFVIANKDNWDGVYDKDDTKKCCNKSIWRSTDKRFIIFWNTQSWIVTSSQYESEISETCGGFISYSTLDQFFV
jgi:hypothetical protein